MFEFVIVISADNNVWMLGCQVCKSWDFRNLTPESETCKIAVQKLIWQRVEGKVDAD